VESAEEGGHLATRHPVLGTEVPVRVARRDLVVHEPVNVVVEGVAVWHIRKLMRCEHHARGDQCHQPSRDEWSHPLAHENLVELAARDAGQRVGTHHRYPRGAWR
jgi:hypothetical protein